jgi:tRNA modification GTPase
MTKTIFALATPDSVSAIGIIRISGPKTFHALSIICDCSLSSFIKKREFFLKKIYSYDKKLLDEALIVCFEQNKSFTSEKMAEIHIHGSLIVIKTVLDALGKISFLREALPGEFTQRALENNKLTLTQVEGLADLMSAETEYQQKQALEIYTGSSNKKVQEWKNIVIKLLSIIEANIDFYDEVDDFELIKNINKNVLILEKDLLKEKKAFSFSESIRSGFTVAIVGKPNSGKSTLINKLAKRSVAITSKLSGTTRDIIELRYNLDGIPIVFLDTAGIRTSKDKIEKIGIQNTLKRANKANLRIILSDTSSDLSSLGLSKSPSDIILRPKGDLQGPEPSISGKTGKGIEELLYLIKEKLAKSPPQSSVISRMRHLKRVNVCLDYINNVKEFISDNEIELELIANELRGIIMNLDGILGLVDTERVLGEIFSNFCIGK